MPGRFVALAVTSALVACGGSNETATGPSFDAVIGLAAAQGGQCSLQDAEGKALASSATVTAEGVARFTDFKPAPLALLNCKGVSYTDPATGKTLRMDSLRTWTELPVGGSGSVVVSPLTEVAVQVLRTRAPAEHFKTVLTQVGKAWGVDGVNFNTARPVHLALSPAADNDASRYGLALVAFSQALNGGKLGKTAESLMGALAANLDDHGFPVTDHANEVLDEAIEAAFDNPRLSANLGDAGRKLAIKALERLDSFVPLAQVDYVETDTSPLRAGAADHDLEPGVPSTLLIGGRDLSLNMVARLGASTCRLRDLVTLDSEFESEGMEMTAECPAQAVGDVKLVLLDRGVNVGDTTLKVSMAGKQVARMRAKSLQQVYPASGTGPGSISGTVQAIAPTFGLPGSPGAHNYSVTRTFAVAGVVVELIDRGAQDAVLLQTATDANGHYSFNGVDADKQVVVRVKAQLLKRRHSGEGSGPAWNLAVRDNTSNTGDAPRALYTLDSAPVQSTASAQTLNITAGMGFNPDGSPLSEAGAERQSAPFSILEVAYKAVTRIAATDANVTLPDVNIYWSPKNTTSSGDLSAGQINTSHYANSGPMPGVYILGKADVDTDEFDQGVIGHELGHWLQSALSYSDNPGGAHAKAEFKDASLAYGEGYGTALGGLLTDNPLYIDASGVKQAAGGVTDLNQATPDGVRKGFYSEESVGYVLYQIGKAHGFGPFWRAVSALGQGHHSATIFSFLASYAKLYPANDVSTWLAQENIRSKDDLGALPAGLSVDPALLADKNKGPAQAGADDLEVLYLAATLPADPVVSATANIADKVPSFCANHNLPGANNANGLGLSKRFVFKAPFSGVLGLKVLNPDASEMDLRNFVLNGRGDDAKNLAFYGWPDANGAMVEVKAGRTYTLRLRRHELNVPFGSQCGYQLAMFRLQ